MKMSVSNIAWPASKDPQMYDFLEAHEVKGLEIAPTRVLGSDPYSNLGSASSWASSLFERYGLVVSSIQSIWYGRNENIFNSKYDRQALLDYTKQAIRFAKTIRCKNIVFGCPKARNVPEGIPMQMALGIALEFFDELGDYAHQNDVVVAIEANPPMYGTNFLNTTKSVIDFLKDLGNAGCRLNLDLGAIIDEFSLEDDVDCVPDAFGALVHDAVPYTHHVHLSEPGLKPLRHYDLCRALITCLDEYGYDSFVSIEMKESDDFEGLKECIESVRTLMKVGGRC